jgi:hypothetical protein
MLCRHSWKGERVDVLALVGMALSADGRIPLNTHVVRRQQTLPQGQPSVKVAACTVESDVVTARKK